MLLASLIAMSLVCFTACDESDVGYLPETTLKFDLARSETKLNAIPLGLLFNGETSYIELNSNGTCTIKMMILDIASLAENPTFGPIISSLDVSGITKSYLEANFLDGYVQVMFPGFSLSDFEGLLGLVKASTGVSITGIDFTQEPFSSIDANLKNPETDAVFPEGFSLSDLPNGLGLEIVVPYALMDETMEYIDDGVSRNIDTTAVRLGSSEPDTAPLLVGTYNKTAGQIKITNAMTGVQIVGYLPTVG